MQHEIALLQRPEGPVADLPHQLSSAPMHSDKDISLQLLTLDSSPEDDLLSVLQDSGSLATIALPVYGPQLPKEYIKIILHPHSLDPTPIIIPITSVTTSPGPIPTSNQPSECPWAPFHCLDDFEYTETAIKGLLSKELIDKQLAGFNSKWAIRSHLTLRNSKDMDDVLAKACEHIIQFKHKTVLVDYQGQTHTFEFKYCDPWAWILAFIRKITCVPGVTQDIECFKKTPKDT